jgi:hypothetical protein
MTFLHGPGTFWIPLVIFDVIRWLTTTYFTWNQVIQQFGIPNLFELPIQPDVSLRSVNGIFLSGCMYSIGESVFAGYNKRCPCMLHNFTEFWVNFLVVMNWTQWYAMNSLDQWTGIMEVHPHFVILRSWIWGPILIFWLCLLGVAVLLPLKLLPRMLVPLAYFYSSRCSSFKIQRVYQIWCAINFDFSHLSRWARID